MVEEAQARRAPTERWVDRFARVYTPAMLLLALGTAAGGPWVAGMAWTESVYLSLVILLIACPCALVISTPVTIVSGLAAAARAGVLIKGGAYLEAPARLRVVALDKTGTLTLGKPEVQRVVALNGHTEEDVLRQAAAIESLSNHPLAQAVVRFARDRGITWVPAQSYNAIEGKGAEAVVDGRRYWVGSHRLLLEQGRDDEHASRQAEAMEDAGHSVVMLGTESHVCGLISVADTVRPGSSEMVKELKAEGIAHVVLLTGDNERTARDIATATGVDAYFAELLPEDKMARLNELSARYGFVAMVGDGVNDAPAMAAAGLGIAMGAAGSDAAVETADIALMSDELARIPWLIRHSKRTLSILRQNVAVALGIKGAVFALALAGLATMWMAILADMGASLLVIGNGLRLLRNSS
jgi:Cd2+/Zn2+-exporting ATPase